MPFQYSKIQLMLSMSEEDWL